jgi:hypothetical protein
MNMTQINEELKAKSTCGKSEHHATCELNTKPVLLGIKHGQKIHSELADNIV